MSQRLSARMSSSSRPQVRVDRVVTRELLVEVLGEHLDVAGLVHHLRRGVVLGVDPRHGLDDARGAEQRALLAVHELRERPVLALDAELDPLLLGPLLERRAREVDGVAEEAAVLAARSSSATLLLVDVDRPVEVGRDVPLRRLRLLVELDERRAAALVVPREDRVDVRADRRASTASTSVLVTERIASRSLISSRPMSSLLVLIADAPFGLRTGRRRSPGRTKSSTSARTCAVVEQVDVLGRAAEVRERDARDPLAEARRRARRRGSA